MSAASPAPPPLGDDLLDLEEEVDRLLEALLAHGDDVADERLDDRRRERSGDRHGDAFGDRRAADRGVLTAHGIRHRREPIGLDADDLDVGPPRVRHDRHPRDQPAATDGHDEHVDLRRVLEQLERDRARAGDDRGVVVGRDEHHPLFGSSRVRPPPPPSDPRLRARPARRASRCGAPSPAASTPASRSWRGCRAGWRGGRPPARGCRPTSRRRRERAPRA